MDSLCFLLNLSRIRIFWLNALDCKDFVAELASFCMKNAVFIAGDRKFASSTKRVRNRLDVLQVWLLTYKKPVTINILKQFQF